MSDLECLDFLQLAGVGPDPPLALLQSGHWPIERTTCYLSNMLRAKPGIEAWIISRRGPEWYCSASYAGRNEHRDFMRIGLVRNSGDRIGVAILRTACRIDL